jgi:hypothetical protein
MLGGVAVNTSAAPSRRFCDWPVSSDSTGTSPLVPVSVTITVGL